MQKLTKFALMWIPLVALGGALVAFSGCESDKDTDTSPDGDNLDTFFEEHPYVSDPRDSSTRLVEVDPPTAVVTEKGQLVVFTAKGGTAPFSWGVSRSDIGTVSAQGERQGRYTATLVAQNSVIVWDSHGNAAIGTIQASAGSMSVTPGSNKLATDGDYVNLTVSGGVPPYSWSVGNQSLGDFSGVAVATGATVKYVRKSAGDNVVKVQDSNNAITSITITQDP